MPGPRRVSLLAAALLVIALAAPASAASPDAGLVLHPTGFVPTTGVPAGLTSFARALIGDAPMSLANVDLSAWAPPVGDQGQVGSCTSWASGYYERYWLRDHALGETTLFAPMYLYSQIARGTDTGSSFPSNFTILDSQGIAPRSVYTQGDFDFTTQPTAAETAAAGSYKASSYARLFSGANSGNQSAIQAALSSGQPVLIAIPVYPEFDKASRSNPLIGTPTAGERSRGNHALFAPKYDANGLWVENSWTTGWGAAGWGELSWDFVNQYALESWTLSSATTDVTTGPTVIGSFSPTSGPVGTVVTIVGSGFTGATGVAFNGKPATFTVASDTRITATVPAGAASGALTVTGAHGSATSTSAFTVGAPTSTLHYTGPTGAGPGTAITLSATLTGGSGAALTGRTVTFTLAGRSYAATTNGSGVASIGAFAPTTTGSYAIGVSFAGDAANAATSTSAAFKVGVVTTKVTYTGPTTWTHNTPVILTATLTTSTGSPLAGKTLTFSWSGIQATAVTNASGVATITRTAPSARVIVRVLVSFAGGGGYGAASTTVPIRIL